VAGSTLTATTSTDSTDAQNTLDEGISQLYVTTVRIADLNTDKQGRDCTSMNETCEYTLQMYVLYVYY